VRLKIAARKSDLARLQAYLVGKAIQARYPNLEVDYIFSSSLGDKNLNDPLWQMPEKGVFTQDLHNSLLHGECDLVVHSWKDLPLLDQEGLTKIAMTLERADQRDLILFRKDRLSRCAETKRMQVFTSSPRRTYNLKSLLPAILPFDVDQVEFLPVRGNIQTRVGKLLTEDSDGLVVAKAALDRLLSAEDSEFAETRLFLTKALKQLQFMVLPLSANPTAAAQGALAVEVLKSNSDLIAKLSECDDSVCRLTVERERQRLRAFGGGCHAPMGFSFLKHQHGLVQFEKGDSQQGEFEFAALHSESQDVPRFSAEEIFPLQPAGSGLFERSNLELRPLPASDLWVARANSLEGYQPDHSRRLWCAGLKSWQQLARAGHWVLGCADQLGESYEPGIDTLLGEKFQPIRITHSRAEAGLYEPFATYELVAQPISKDLASKQCFFWMSSSSFDYALEQLPQLADRWHCSGVGKTAEHIRQRLGPNGKFAVFYSYTHWKEQVLK
jgi:hydroxymethylbilane synthase